LWLFFEESISDLVTLVLRIYLCIHFLACKLHFYRKWTTVCMLLCENRVNFRNTLCNTRLWRIWHPFPLYQCIWYRGPDGPTREAPNRPAAGRRMVGREIPDEHEDSDDTESLTALYASPPPTRKASLTISESMSHRWGKKFWRETKQKNSVEEPTQLCTWWNLSVQ
jgi:hypothetical protein